MNILAINSGSSSLKFKMYQMPSEDVLIYGYIEKIGADSEYKIVTDKVYNKKINIPSFDDAAKILIKELFENNIISSLDEIDAIGHRIVNGKDHYETEIIDSDSIKRLENIKNLSPVHMEGHIASIKALRKVTPETKQYTIYDTAFHHSIPLERSLYAVPYTWYEEYGVKKYGFHGISCQYITDYMEKELNKKVNLIICHIGYGASVTLVENSKSIDTSMGFTANCGLIMGSRCGTIDYSILPYMQEKGYTLEKLDYVLNHESGLEGFVKGGSDNRDLQRLIDNKDEKAILVNEMYENSLVDYIAMYYNRISDIDAIIFCGGVGENNTKYRENVLNKLSKLGIVVDRDINSKITKFSNTPSGKITKDTSKIQAYVIPTDEEVMIAREVYKMIK